MLTETHLRSNGRTLPMQTRTHLRSGLSERPGRRHIRQRPAPRHRNTPQPRISYTLLWRFAAGFHTAALPDSPTPFKASPIGDRATGFHNGSTGQKAGA